MLRKIICVSIISFCCALFFCTGAFGSNTTVDSSSVIQVNDGLLTVKVKDMPLKKVLEEITKQIPIKLVFLVSGEEPLMADFSSLTLEKGLRHLLRNYNYTFVKGTEKSKGEGNEIKKVIILSKAEENKYRETEPTTVTQEEESNNEDSEFATDLKETTSTASLNENLHDKDPIKREEAVISLGEMGDENSVNLLTDVLSSDEDESVRMMAAESLGSIGSEEGVYALEAALNDGADIVRESAILALSLIGGDEAIKALESALPGSDDAMKEMITEELELLKE